MTFRQLIFPTLNTSYPATCVQPLHAPNVNGMKITKPPKAALKLTYCRIAISVANLTHLATADTSDSACGVDIVHLVNVLLL